MDCGEFFPVLQLQNPQSSFKHPKSISGSDSLNMDRLDSIIASVSDHLKLDTMDGWPVSLRNC